MMFDDTIAAISTPLGMGGISVIRVSGKNSIPIARNIFVSKNDLEKSESHTVHYGQLVDPFTHEIVDSVLLTVMREPKTYTGLDTVEISCHGGVINTRKVLELVLSQGARLAEAGEFTKLAFLNGKMDLSQVEAVADIIHAKTEGARRSSASQFLGSLSNEIKGLREELLKLCSLLELDLDFAEENLLNIDATLVREKIEVIENQIKNLLATYNFGHIIREGAKVAIIGKPNVGKSSLLNALLLKERAIVSDVPGTTRDYIEETIDINGIPFTLVDTAGIRAISGKLEKMGINLSKEILESCDLILLLFDISKPLDENDLSIIDLAKEQKEKYQNLHIVYIANKIDSKDISSENLSKAVDKPLIKISAKTKTGLQELKNHIAHIFSNDVSFDSPVISRLRHKIALEKSIQSLALAKETIGNGVSFEFAAIDVRNAISHLGEIIGEIKSDEVLNNIFSSFCIGK